MALSDDIFDFLKDLDDDSVTTLDREFRSVTKQHAAETIQKNVDLRIPPHQDKRSLQYRYHNLSMKKMKTILKEAKEGKRPKVANPIPLIREELERELQHLQEAVENGEETLEHEFYGGTTTPGGRDLPDGATWKQTAPPPKISIEDGFEFDYYLKHLEEDDSWDGGQESPYKRSAKQLRKFKNASTEARDQRHRPQSATVTRSAPLTGKGGDVSAGVSALEKEALSRSYQDLHGVVGRARDMAPSPVKNTSLQHLVSRRLKKEEESRELYQSVLQEARLMQMKFHSCVKEANYFARMLHKGDEYSIIERDATEEAQWAALLANKKAPASSAVIPKGTGARIAHTLVQVSNHSRDKRFLGTDHFFREHGRLQNEFQKHRSVRKLQKGREAGLGGLDSKTGHGTTSNSVGISSKSLRRTSGLVTSSSEAGTGAASLMTAAQSRLSGGGAAASSSPQRSGNDTTGGRSGSSSGRDGDRDRVKAGTSSSHLGHRKEVVARLQDLLQVQVCRSFEIKHQLEDIHRQGWNAYL